MPHSWPLLLVVVALLVAGSTKAALEGTLDGLSVALLTAGMVALGVWIERGRND